LIEKLKVLIVEDNKQICTLYRVGLYDAVFEKHFETNGRDALEAYRAWQPDIIILDIMLPVISGYEVLRRIRMEARDKTTPIIMASALSGKGEISECIKLGVQGYLVKPFTHREVAAKVLEYYGKVNSVRAKDLKVAYEAARSRDLRG
jgi:DNA-binding response OmpR family regulator